MPCGECCRAHLCFSQKVGVPQTAFGPDGRVKRQSSETPRSNCPASSSGSTPGLCPQVHLFSHVPSCLSLLKGGVLSSRLRFVIKNRCQDIHNCQHLDGRADSSGRGAPSHAQESHKLRICSRLGCWMNFVGEFSGGCRFCGRGSTRSEAREFEVRRPLTSFGRMTMKFMLILKATKESEAGKMPSEESIAAMVKYNQEQAKAGILLDAAGRKPRSKGGGGRFAARGRKK